MTTRTKELNIYYDFALKCDDSIELMVKVLKKHFCSKKPSRIRYQLEYTIIDEYIDVMKNITDDEITKCRNAIANENGSLFYFEEC